MVNAQQYRALDEALNGVYNAGQAVAAADLCLSTLREVRDQFGGWATALANYFTGWLYGLANPDRADAAKRLSDAIVDVERFRGPLDGDRARPILGGDGDWDNLRHAIERAYNVMWAVQDVQGDEPEWKHFQGWALDTVTGSVQAMPLVIASAIGAVSSATTQVVGSVAGGLLPLWPLAVAVTAVLVLGALAARKGGLA